MAKDKFKNALRFKLVQRSVRDQASRQQQDAGEDNSTTAATAVDNKARTFAPMNEAAKEHLVRLLDLYCK